MNLEEEVKKFMQSHKSEEKTENILSFETEQSKEELFKKLTKLYENASNYEIERAVENALDIYGIHPEEKPFFEYLRKKLED